MNLERHPLSIAYTDMTAEEYVSFKDSIEVNGVLNPITLYQSMVLDGWHRYKAAKELNMHCPTQLLPQDVDPKDYAEAQNGKRKHRTASQLAMCAAQASQVPLPHRPNKSDTMSPLIQTAEEVAKQAGVSKRTIQRARKVAGSAIPEVIAAVQRGEIGVMKASNIASLPPEQQSAAISKPIKKSGASKPKRTLQQDPAPADTNHGMDAVKILCEENDRLTDRLAIAAMDATEEERSSAKDLIATLRHQVLVLECEMKAVKSSRDGYMTEVSELKKQCVKNKRQIEKLTKQAHASEPIEAF